MNYLKFYASIFLCCIYIQVSAQNDVTATINTSNLSATMSNDIITLTINSKARVNSLTYNGTDLINSSSNGRFYLSYNDADGYNELSPDSIRIQKYTEDYAEVVYSNTSGNLILEQGFILKKGVSGLYSYVTVKGTSSTVKVREMRVVYRVDPDLFDYGYVTNEMQGELPTIAQMKAADDDPIMDATYELADGTIYTKYNWANYVAQDSVHGLMSDNSGIWAIPVSAEYVNGGPMRQELTVHTTTKTPLVLQMLQGEHFGASAQSFSSGDKKIYGPFFIYINSGDSHNEMIEDAKDQASVQKAQWPFSWFENDLYTNDRTIVKGTLKTYSDISPKGFQMVLAQPGEDIYEQGKDYIFWTKTDSNGNFSIPNVIPNTYSLYAYATEGEVTDEFELENVVVENSVTNLGTIEWYPTKYTYKLFQLGESNRLADGYKYSDTIRAYGLYELPAANTTYNVESGNIKEDWYYAQTKSGSWNVEFNNTIDVDGLAYLTASFAGSSNNPNLDVYINDSLIANWSLSSDPCIYRSAVLSGVHQLKTVSFSTSKFVQGTNTITFKMSNVGTRGGAMYDCIKLEIEPESTEIETLTTNNSNIKCYPNPCNNELYLSLDTEETGNLTFKIFNINGKLVKSYTLEKQSGNITINVSTLHAGTYTYQVFSRDLSVFKHGIFIKK